MPFSINDFTTSIATYGTAPTNKFDVSITLPPIMTQFPYGTGWDDLIPMRASDVSTPGVASMNHEAYNLGAGKKITQPYNVAITPLRVALIADAEGIIEETLTLWLNLVVNYSFDNTTLPTFMLNYRSQTISPQITINKYDSYGNIINTYNIVGAIPTVISSQKLNWGGTNTLALINVTFNYSGYSLT